MRRRVVWLLCACGFLLPSCSQDTKAPEDRSFHTSAPRSTNDAVSDNKDGEPVNDAKSGSDAKSDAAALRALLGSSEAPSCPEDTPPGNALCRKLLDSSAKLVDYVGVALESMPKTSAYKDISKAVDNFDQAYKTARRCYEPGAEEIFGKDSKAKRLCSTLAAGTGLAWIGIDQAIRDLEQSG